MSVRICTVCGCRIGGFRLYQSANATTCSRRCTEERDREEPKFEALPVCDERGGWRTIPGHGHKRETFLPG